MIFSNFSAVAQVVPVGADPIGVTVSGDSRRVYVANSAGDSVSVLDATTDTLLGQVLLAPGAYPPDVAVSPDDRLLFVTGLGNHTLSVVDTTSLTVVDVLAAGNLPVGVAAGAAPLLCSRTRTTSLART